MRISDWSSDFCSSDLLPSRSAGVGTRLAPTTSGGSSTAEPSAPCATAGDGQGKIKENTSMRPAPMRGPGPSDIVEICLVPVDGPPSRLACPGEACTGRQPHQGEDGRRRQGTMPETEAACEARAGENMRFYGDRKSTRLNSSH